MSAYTIFQHSHYCYIYADVEEIRYAVNPYTLENWLIPEGIEVDFGENILFNTPGNLEIFAPPAVQAPDVLQAALLSQFHLSYVRILPNGNLQVKISETDENWYCARGALVSMVAEGATLGLGINNGVASLTYVDEEGQTRAQTFYPAPADPNAFFQATLNTNGFLSFEVNGESYAGQLDYLVTPGAAPESGGLEVEAIEGTADVLIIYPDGSRQRLFGY